MKKLITASVLSLAALSAHAADPGFYVFGNTGYNFSKLESGNRNIILKDAKAAGTVWELGAGYRFNQYLATELSYADFGKSKANGSIAPSVPVFGGSRGDVSVATKAERIAVLGILPVTQDLEVFGKASLNNVHTKLKIDQVGNKTFNDTRLGLGFGAQYQLHKNLSLRGEYEYIAGNDFQMAGQSLIKTSGTSVLKAGISYHF
ncbi:outer membrane beta-barrel protein [Chromobacterium haemolyticum]|uniref:outer membrane beta-barrel protein n=1 Tax=Chromobacterium haemolyticum TaxID=394935 RepID=UPI0005BB3369|nr:outer membrane beta-barrel protein [Chromobacterium haemolyticum]UGA39568.1 outer membrane beta-barrel protein [Chromobacterium haemolyticum]